MYYSSPSGILQHYIDFVIDRGSCTFFYSEYGTLVSRLKESCSARLRTYFYRIAVSYGASLVSQQFDEFQPFLCYLINFVMVIGVKHDAISLVLIPPSSALVNRDRLVLLSCSKFGPLSVSLLFMLNIHEEPLFSKTNGCVSDILILYKSK